MATSVIKEDLFLRSRTHREWRHRKSIDSAPLCQSAGRNTQIPSSTMQPPFLHITPPESEGKLWSPEGHEKAVSNQQLEPFPEHVNHDASLAETDMISTERSLRNLLRYFENMTDKPATTQIARTCHVLSRCLLYQGRIAEAEVYQWRSFLSNLDELGPDHPETIASMSCLSSLLYQQRRYQQAKELGQRALENTEKVYGPGHWRTIAATKQLALVVSAVQNRTH